MIRVSLMGGLGNQLFQLAFGLNASKDENFALIPLMKNVRKTKLGTPDICDLSLPNRVKIMEQNKFDNPLLTKLLGLGLRSSSSNSNPILVSFLEGTVPVLSGDPIFSLRYSKGLGSQIKVKKHSDALYIGYFQSHRFASNSKVFGELMELSPLRSSKELEDIIKRLKIEEPYMVHVRLTDYTKQNSFGVPSQDYYRESLESLFDSIGGRSIWVFSDDIERALKYLPKEFFNHYVSAPLLQSTVLNWELMRSFSGYVIGNSSFSWWSAFLRHNQFAPVYHPWPWFKVSNQSKSDLIPPDWYAVHNNFA